MTQISQPVKRITLEAEIKRADGTIEKLGPVAEYNEKSWLQSKLLGGIQILNPELYHRYLGDNRNG